MSSCGINGCGTAFELSPELVTEVSSKEMSQEQESSESGAVKTKCSSEEKETVEDTIVVTSTSFCGTSGYGTSPESSPEPVTNFSSMEMSQEQESSDRGAVKTDCSSEENETVEGTSTQDQVSAETTNEDMLSMAERIELGGIVSKVNRTQSSLFIQMDTLKEIYDYYDQIRRRLRPRFLTSKKGLDYARRVRDHADHTHGAMEDISPVTDRAETQLFSLLLDLDVYSNEKLYKQVLAKRMKLDQ